MNHQIANLDPHQMFPNIWYVPLACVSDASQKLSIFTLSHFTFTTHKNGHTKNNKVKATGLLSGKILEVSVSARFDMFYVYRSY